MNLTETYIHYLKLSTNNIPLVFLSFVEIVNLELTFTRIIVWNRNRGKNIALKKPEDECPHANCGERTEHDTPVPGKLCLQWDR